MKLWIKVPSEGSVALTTWLKTEKMSQKELSLKMGVARPTIAHWALGLSSPSSQFRPRLQEITGIAPEAWDFKVEDQS